MLKGLRGKVPVSDLEIAQGHRKKGAGDLAIAGPSKNTITVN